MHVWYGPVSGSMAADTSDLTYEGENAQDWFGYTVGTPADANGDGLLDLMVGAQEHETTGSRAGATYLFLGGGW